MNATFYKPTFYRHLHHLAISGFFARELDADDFEFLEYVKARGIANGSLPNTSTVLIEELEFWHLPYSMAPNIVRRAGPVPLRIAETPEQQAARKARSTLWHARRALRAQDKAIADLELERERREWQAANEKRKARELRSDLEWEAADPHRNKFGATVNRHHVPQWKLDEIRDEHIKLDKLRAQAIRERKKQKALEREQAKLERERAHNEKIIAEARDTMDRLNAARGTNGRHRDKNSIKRAIVTLIHNSAPAGLAIEDIMRALDIGDRDSLQQLLNELMLTGEIRDRWV